MGYRPPPKTEGRLDALVPGNVLLGLFGGKPTLDYSCAHDGAHPGVGVVYDPCVHWNQPGRKENRTVNEVEAAAARPNKASQ